MRRYRICTGMSCIFEHSYCYTCWKEVCEACDAELHRSVDHDVQCVPVKLKPSCQCGTLLQSSARESRLPWIDTVGWTFEGVRPAPSQLRFSERTEEGGAWNL